MKDQFLKLAGVKSEKEFYKLFPDEKTFMAKYGKQIKKLQLGSSMPNNKPAKVGSFTGNEKSVYNPINYGDVYDDVDYSVTGSNRQMRMDQANLASQQEIAQNSKKKNGLFDMLGQLAPALNSLSGEEGAVDLSSIDMRYGGRLRKAENGFNQGVMNFGKKVETFGQKVGQGYDKVDSGLGKIGGVAGGIGIAEDLTKGIGAMVEEKRQKDIAKQSFGLSEVTRQASQSLPEITNRNYLRPEDQITYADQFNKPGGVGTNVLAVNGARINSGEIQNIYNPGNIYSDLEDEPLNNKGKSKYKKGGKIEKAQLGIDKMAGQAGNQLGSLIFGGKGQPTGAGQVGSTIGSTVGKFIPIPGASAVLGGVGGFIGSAFGAKNLKETANYQEGADRNLAGQAFEQGARGMLNQNSQFAKYGASVSDDIQPQFIKQFGDYTMNQLLQPDPMMNTLRSGGNLREYTPPSGRALQTYEQGGEVNSYALGGQLQTHWGGGAETISRNPYLPGTGETIMFRGKSHEEYSPNGETGIGVTYGGNPVEVERGEPMVELQEGGVVDPATGEVQKSGVVFGNLQIPDQYIPMLGDKNAKGKKFKTYVDDLSKTEADQNKLVSSSSKKLNDLNVDSPYDKLSFSGLQANLLGANMKLKDIADKKIKAASLQSAINDTAEEYGFVADDLAKGKVTKAKMGASIAKAIDGINQPIDSVTKEERAKAKQLYESGDVEGFQKYAQEIAPDIVKNIIREKGMPSAGTFADKLKGPRTEEVYNQIMNPILSELPGSRLPGRGQIELPRNMPGVSTEKRGGQPASEVAKESPFDWMSIANQVLPYVRPSDAEQLDPRQLSGEMFALATNQLQPVQAQTFQPQLGTPYDISLQDQLNANQSDYRALQRMTGYNPAAQGMLNAQKYSANQQVLGEQFRANQAMKDKVYGENRQLLNESNLKNLAIFDQQYDRQASALANTKATTQAALNSISSKYAQNQLENRNLQTYENLYNYRFDTQGRAVSMNPLAQFAPQGSGSPDLSTMSSEQIKQLAEIKKMEELEAKKAKEVASGKKRNGSIVRAIKNL